MKPEQFKYLRRYSLRTLFVLMTLCCLLFGAWAVYVNPYRQQQRSLAVVNRLQGTVTQAPAEGPAWQGWLVTTMLGENAFAQVTGVDLNNKKVGDADLRQLVGLIHVGKLALDYTDVTDGGIVALESMPKLQTISLRYTTVSDGGAAQLGRLPNLRVAHLTGTKITDAGIDALAGHPQMKELYVRWTGITDAGAERLAAALPDCAVHYHALVPP
jgi:hypothetical protein